MARPHGTSELSCLTQEFDETRGRVQQRTALLARLVLTNDRLHREAQAALTARDRFLSVAAHELNTPVTSMLGFAQLALLQVRRAQAETGRIEAALTTAERQAIKLKRMIAQLLDVSRIDSGKFELDRQQFDLTALVRRAIDEVQVAFSRTPIVLSAPPRLDAWVDGARLEQVVVNLVVNAAKFGPADVPIDVELTSAADAAVRLMVRDRGPGIPMEHRELDREAVETVRHAEFVELRVEDLWLDILKLIEARSPRG